MVLQYAGFSSSFFPYPTKKWIWNDTKIPEGIMWEVDTFLVLKVLLVFFFKCTYICLEEILQQQEIKFANKTTLFPVVTSINLLFLDDCGELGGSVWVSLLQWCDCDHSVNQVRELVHHFSCWQSYFSLGSVPWSCLLNGTAKVGWCKFCRMVVFLSRKEQNSLGKLVFCWIHHFEKVKIQKQVYH